jgi:hypothetical protein
MRETCFVRWLLSHHPRDRLRVGFPPPDARLGRLYSKQSVGVSKSAPIEERYRVGSSRLPTPSARLIEIGARKSRARFF